MLEPASGAPASTERASATTFYFAVALAICWLALLPASLAALGILPGPPEAYMAGAPLAVLSPTIAAVLAARREGPGTVRELFRGLGAWRFGPIWLVLAITLPGLIYAKRRRWASRRPPATVALPSRPESRRFRNGRSASSAINPPGWACRSRALRTGGATSRITATGMFFLDYYVCVEQQARQQFRWTLADDGQSLGIQTDPSAEVFTFGNGNQVSEVVVEPGDTCDAIVVRYFDVSTMRWGEARYFRGNVCARTTGSDGCTFTFEWCDGVPPLPCE